MDKVRKTRISNEEMAERIENLMPIFNGLRRTLRFEVVLITPEIAEEWLKKNVKNRRTDLRKNSYSRQMIDNVWGFSGQPIIFSNTDLLLDGGGRLASVVSSNVPIICTVIYGVPEDSFELMDSIKARTIKDVLEASHYLDGEKKVVANCVASMGKRVLEWISGRYGSHGASTTRTVANNSEILNFIKDNLPVMRDCAKACVEMRGAHRENLVSKRDYFGSMMAYLTIVKGWDFVDVYNFFNELTNTRSVVREDGNPIATLRTYLSMERMGNIKITDEERFHMFSRSWNYYCKGEEIKRFSLKKCKDIPMCKFELVK